MYSRNGYTGMVSSVLVCTWTHKPGSHCSFPRKPFRIKLPYYIYIEYEMIGFDKFKNPNSIFKKKSSHAKKSSHFSTNLVPPQQKLLKTLFSSRTFDHKTSLDIFRGIFYVCNILMFLIVMACCSCLLEKSRLYVVRYRLVTQGFTGGRTMSPMSCKQSIFLEVTSSM